MDQHKLIAPFIHTRPPVAIHQLKLLSTDFSHVSTISQNNTHLLCNTKRQLYEITQYNCSLSKVINLLIYQGIEE